MLSPGSEALFRFVWPGRVFSAMPVTVVEHRDDRIVLWLCRGTAAKAPPNFRISIRDLAEENWDLTDWRWYGSRLMIWRPGDAHSTYVAWDDDGEFLGWYVNLEDPWRRTRFGWDSTDHLLDVRVDPDRTWHWKDEDHLAEAVEVGLFSPEDAAAVRQEGERAIERIGEWRAPFGQHWEEWCPDPDWPLPKMPQDWDVL